MACPLLVSIKAKLDADRPESWAEYRAAGAKLLDIIAAECRTSPKIPWEASHIKSFSAVAGLIGSLAAGAGSDPANALASLAQAFVPADEPSRIALSNGALPFRDDRRKLADMLGLDPAAVEREQRIMDVPPHRRPPAHWSYDPRPPEPMPRSTSIYSGGVFAFLGEFQD